MNILQAIDDPHLFAGAFRDAETWKSWRAVLCALFGLPMTQEQFELYQQCTGRSTAPAAVFNEAWLICGRRGGKSFTLALIAVFLACFRGWAPYLTAGERGYVVIVAADRKQARTIMGYVKAIIAQTPMLAELVARETVEELELTNRISIEVATCSFRTIRGRTIVAALCDEIAFWHDENSSNPDVEILAAIRPAMATVPGAMLLCASSPYARRGALWEAYQRWHGKDDAPALIWRAPTTTMNPTIPPGVLEEAYDRDPASAAAEYGAEFRTDVERLLTREAIEGCIDQGVHERPYDRRNRYVGFADPSGGSSDAFTLAIAHREGKTAVLDVVRERVPPFSPETVIAEYASLLKTYKVTTVHADRYAGEFVTELFRKNGVHHEPSEKSKSEIYIDAVAAVNSAAVALLDHDKLTRQLIGLERRTTRGGKDSVDHAPGGHDDLANSAAGALGLVDKATGDVNFSREIKYPMAGVA